MPAQFEVFTTCPTTGKEVNTGVVVPNEAFSQNEKPYGTFNCPACQNGHVWTFDQVTIRTVYR